MPGHPSTKVGLRYFIVSGRKNRMGLHIPTWNEAENGEVSRALPGPRTRAVTFGPKGMPFQEKAPPEAVGTNPSKRWPSSS